MPGFEAADILETISHLMLSEPQCRSFLPWKVGAFVETMTYLTIVVLGIGAFDLGLLSVDQAATVCAGLLVTLLLLAWFRFYGGQHPAFLFLCMLTLLQGGRLLVHCLGYLPDPMRIGSFTVFGFDMPKQDAGLTLLAIALSAICIYAPCRWNYQFFSPSTHPKGKQYLNYLYLVFFITVVVECYKAYAYYQVANLHGGYLYFFINHADIAASVPFIVRAFSLLELPVFVTIFVLEHRRKWLVISTILYFGSMSFVMLLGTRALIFSLALVLWYVTSIKSRRKTRLAGLIVLGSVLLVVGWLIQAFREDDAVDIYTFAPIEFVKLQGNSLDVTETAVRYRSAFEPFAFDYLEHELQNAFIASDISNYYRGKSLAFDVPVLLNRGAFLAGRGTGGSYVAEAYVLGAIPGVILISLLIGFGLNRLYFLSRHPISLVIVAMILPDVLILSRGNLLDWLSVVIKNSIMFFVLYCGWLGFRLCVWLGQGPVPIQQTSNGTIPPPT